MFFTHSGKSSLKIYTHMCACAVCLEMGSSSFSLAFVRIKTFEVNTAG